MDLVIDGAALVIGGSVIDGWETLDQMEKVPTGPKDRSALLEYP
jgi:hypothetical protein